MGAELTTEDILTTSECIWAASYNTLLKRGYQLRTRYSPDWEPSWGREIRFPEDGYHEDALVNFAGAAIDAIQLSTGKKVVIKRATIEEASVAMYLQSLGPAGGENRTVPVIEVFSSPNTDGEVFIVMPLLREMGELPFRRVGEFVEAMHQFLTGLAFMHRHNVAHRDACDRNLCMDATRMIPKGYHFSRKFSHDGVRGSVFHWRPRSSVSPIQYYFIDFGLSSRYPPGKDDILDIGIVGQDKSVPEMSLTRPYDPFKMDVYQLGNALKDIVKEYEGLEWVMPLLESMTRQNPKSRVSANQALSSMIQLTSSLGRKDLRRRIWLKSTDSYRRFKIRYLGENPLWS